MVGYFDVEEGVVIIYEDGACFALLVDTEHLDTEFVGVDGGEAFAFAAAAAGAPITVC